MVTKENISEVNPNVKMLCWLIAGFVVLLGSLIGIFLTPFFIWVFNARFEIIILVVGSIITLFILPFCFSKKNSRETFRWIARVILLNALCLVISGVIALTRFEGIIYRDGDYLRRGDALYSKFGVFVDFVGTIY